MPANGTRIYFRYIYFHGVNVIMEKFHDYSLNEIRNRFV